MFHRPFGIDMVYLILGEASITAGNCIMADIRYILVICYIAIEHAHFSWENARTFDWAMASIALLT